MKNNNKINIINMTSNTNLDAFVYVMFSMKH